MSGSLFDYIRWRGDLPLTGDSFNEVDNLVLCQLTYSDLGRCFKSGTTLRECAEKLLGSGGTVCRLIVETEEDREILAAAAGSRRFGELLLLDVTERFDGVNSTQFAAVTFEIEKDLCFVGFRGTDCTLAGWKENFMISFREVKSQRLALEYLRDRLRLHSAVIVGGHSKGSNLALYAASMLEEFEQERLRFVYLNDGPGLCREVVDCGRLSRIKNKSLRICPSYSIVGQLFDCGEIPEKRVRSTAVGPFQHALVTWQVSASEVCEADKADPGAERVNAAVAEFVDGMDSTGREQFVDSLFGLASNRKDALFTDFRGLESFERAALRLLKYDRPARRALLGGRRSKNERRLSFKRLSEFIGRYYYYHGAVFALIGALCCLFPPVLPVAVTALGAAALLDYQIISALRELEKVGWQPKKRRLRLLSLTASAVLFLVLVLRRDSLGQFSGFFCGSVLSVFGAAFVLKAIRGESLFRAVEGVCLIATGIAFLFSEPSFLLFPTLALGFFLLIDGSVRTVFRAAGQRFSGIKKSNTAGEK